MQLILPPHSIPATPVKNWREIKQAARELRHYVNHGEFTGECDKAFALGHAQVSRDPKTFFCLTNNKQHKLPKLFGHWCVINLKILEQEDPTQFKEACMSWPHRKPRNKTRFYKVKVEYYIPLLGILRKKVKTFVEIPAYICQHETEHAQGKNMYNKYQDE